MRAVHHPREALHLHHAHAPGRRLEPDPVQPGGLHAARIRCAQEGLQPGCADGRAPLVQLDLRVSAVMGMWQHAYRLAHASLHARPARAHASHEELWQPVLSRHSPKLCAPRVSRLWGRPCRHQLCGDAARANPRQLPPAARVLLRTPVRGGGAAARVQALPARAQVTRCWCAAGARGCMRSGVSGGGGAMARVVGVAAALVSLARKRLASRTRRHTNCYMRRCMNNWQA